MRDPTAIKRRDISTSVARARLRQQPRPYYALLSYNRHIGYHNLPTGKFWVARYRTKAGTYCQHRLGNAANDTSHGDGLSYEEAVELALKWFSELRNSSRASQSKPVGSTRQLMICPIGDEPTIGHALKEWVEWKRLAATKTHFETSISLINYHIVPRLASVRLRDFNGTILKEFIKHVLETPPKRGNQQQAPIQPISALSEDALRKRKKTVNTIIGILRLSIRLAWENGIVDNERALRCLRRLPSVDRPRIIHLSRSEARGLLECCREDVRRLVLGALYTGCRVTELVRMICSDVGRDGYGVYIAPLKAYRPRFVFLPDEAMIWFLDLIRGRRSQDHVFLRYDGKPWLDRSYRYAFAVAVHEAELPEGFVFHSLRHTYASQLIQSGTSIFAIAEQLGHADPVTVLKTYGHLSPQIRESEVRQRFTTLDRDNKDRAIKHGTELMDWRQQLHGGDPPAPPRPPAPPPPSQQASSQTSAPRPAEQQAQQAAAPQTAVGTQPNAAAVERWQSNVLRHLAQRRRYPPGAQQRGEQGVAVIRFTIDISGRVLSIALTGSSGFAELDQAAVDLVNRSSPVPAPPQGLPQSRLTLTVPIEYTRR